MKCHRSTSADEPTLLGPEEKQTWQYTTMTLTQKATKRMNATQKQATQHFLADRDSAESDPETMNKDDASHGYSSQGELQTKDELYPIANLADC